jgi:ABC-2 type transport system permease protein
MKGPIGLYCGFAKVAIRSALAHRSSYWAGVAAQWLSYGATFATLYIMVQNFQVLAGWNAAEILFLYAMNLLSYALGACLFFNPCIGLADKIRTGEFDAALTKPVSPFGHEFYMGFNFGYVSHITLSLAVMIFAAFRVGLVLTPLGVLTFFGMLLGAVLVQAAFLIFPSAFSFLLINDNPVFSLFWASKEFIHYPLPIYPVVLQVLLTFVLPFAFMNFYPASVILGKETGVPFPAWLGYTTPLVGIILLVLSILFWNWALKKYQSTGT